MGKNVRRNYKDTVFRMLFRIPEHALSLYNALNGTGHTDPSMLEFCTLENAIYLNMKNDLSFYITSELQMYEQQATHTPNMPLRNLFYVSDVLQTYVKDKAVYSSKLIRLPSPRFVVFYNGRQELPEKLYLRLSDAYRRPGDRQEEAGWEESEAGESVREEPSLELKVTVYNINPGMNQELKRKCPLLGEYMTYVDRVRTHAGTMGLAEAAERAVEECIRENVLRDFLRRQKAEVVKMSIYEYDEEREMRLMREDERELGREEEREKRLAAERQAREAVRQKESAVREAVKEKEAAEKQKKAAEKQKKAAEKQAREACRSIVELCRETGQSRETARNHLIRRCRMNARQAEALVERCWNG